MAKRKVEFYKVTWSMVGIVNPKTEINYMKDEIIPAEELSPEVKHRFLVDLGCIVPYFPDLEGLTIEDMIEVEEEKPVPTGAK